MSAKINVFFIIIGHIKTLKSAGEESLNFSDIFTFFIFPLLISATGVYSGFQLNNDFVSILINFGSIFTALLFSVLVLIYDQENKLLDKESNGQAVRHIETKKTILKQLYFNISYCIINSVILVVFSTAGLIFEKGEVLGFSVNSYLLTPICMFIALNLVFTILMIVKRMHRLLTSS